MAKKVAPDPTEMTKQLLDFANLLQTSYTIDKVLETAVNQCKDMFNATASALYLIHPSSGGPEASLVMRDCCGYDRVPSSDQEKKQAYLSDIRYPLRSPNGAPLGLTAQIALSKKAVFIEKREDFKKQKQYGAGTYHGDQAGKYDHLLWQNPKTCQSFIGVPLISADDCVGVLKVESEHQEYFTTERKHREYLEVLGQMIADTVSSLWFLHGMRETTKILAVTRPDEETLQTLVESCVTLCRAEASSLFLYSDDDNGLILRADHGHDYNLCHMPGPPNKKSSKDYIYDGRGKSGPGLTWKCFKKIEPVECKNKAKVTSAKGHGDKLWPAQWKKRSKACHSIYLHPVFTKAGKSKKELGVLKVENKQELQGDPREDGGFSDQDKQAIQTLAEAIAPLAEDMVRRGYWGWAYSPEEVFGKPVLDKLQATDFNDALAKLKHGDALGRELADFVGKLKDQRQMMGYYSRLVVRKMCEIAGVFNLKDTAQILLTGLYDYEILLKRIPRYREHFVHQFNVFLLGLVMIVENKTTREWMIAKHKDYTLRDWFITACFHDVGLPIEKLSAAVSVLIGGCLHMKEPARMSSYPFSIACIEDYHRAFKGLERAVEQVTDSKLLKGVMASLLHSLTHPGDGDFAGHNHSLISACMVEENLSKQKVRGASRNRILSAILLHESRVPKDLNDRVKSLKTKLSEPDHNDLMARSNEIVSLSHYPLTFLLGICDTIQNWGRPDQEAERYRQSVSGKSTITLSELEVDDKRINVDLMYSKQPQNWTKVYNDVIKPQSGYWRKDVDDLKMGLHFSKLTAKGQPSGLEPSMVDFPTQPID